jgi:hypothetical protein
MNLSVAPDEHAVAGLPRNTSSRRDACQAWSATPVDLPKQPPLVGSELTCPQQSQLASSSDRRGQVHRPAPTEAVEPLRAQPMTPPTLHSAASVRSRCACPGTGGAIILVFPLTSSPLGGSSYRAADVAGFILSELWPFHGPAVIDHREAAETTPAITEPLPAIAVACASCRVHVAPPVLTLTLTQIQGVRVKHKQHC